MNSKPHTIRSTAPVAADSASSVERRCCVQFAVTASALLLVIAAFNLIVDPYAQYFGGVLKPLVQTSRAQKVALLDQLADDPVDQQPEALVLGSSRVLKFEPAYLQNQFGLRFFNAGVNYGKTEDALALLKLYEESFGREPRMVVLGLDVNSFTNASPPDARLLSQQQLSRQITDYLTVEDRLHRWKSLLSWQQTKSSLKSLKLGILGGRAIEPTESFRSDGLIEYHQRMKELAAGDYDFEGALEYNKHEYRSLFQQFDRISETRRAAFFEIVDRCRKSDTRLVVLLTPLHPDLREYLLSNSSYADRKREVTDMIATASRFFHFEFKDFSNTETFAGDVRDFVDGIHPLESNTRRMIRILASSEQSSDEPQSHFISR